MRVSARTSRAIAIAIALHLILGGLIAWGLRDRISKSLVVQGGGFHEAVEVISGARPSGTRPARIQKDAPLATLGTLPVENVRNAQTSSGVGGGEAVLVGAERPEYPLLSRRLGEEGSVRLRLVITPEGKVTDAQVAHSSGFERLDRSALEFARRARFQASSQTLTQDYTVNFELKTSGS